MTPPKPPNAPEGYVIEKLIARGTYGAVYEARRLESNQRVALKYEVVDCGPSEVAFLKRIAWWNTEHFVQLLDTVYVDGIKVTVFNFESETLESFVARRHVFDDEQLWNIASQLLKACILMQKLAESDVSHRDIKPANILIDEFESVKLADFGFVKSGQHTTFAGTGHYMAPEFYRSTDPRNSKVDIWSIGVVLVELARGRDHDSFETYTAALANDEALNAHVDGIIAALSRRRPSKLVDMIGEMLIVNSRIRPSAAALYDRYPELEQEYVAHQTRKAARMQRAMRDANEKQIVEKELSAQVVRLQRGLAECRKELSMYQRGESAAMEKLSTTLSKILEQQHIVAQRLDGIESRQREQDLLRSDLAALRVSDHPELKKLIAGGADSDAREPRVTPSSATPPVTPS